MDGGARRGRGADGRGRLGGEMMAGEDVLRCTLIDQGRALRIASDGVDDGPRLVIDLAVVTQNLLSDREAETAALAADDLPGPFAGSLLQAERTDEAARQWHLDLSALGPELAGLPLEVLLARATGAWVVRRLPHLPAVLGPPDRNRVLVTIAPATDPESVQGVQSWLPGYVRFLIGLDERRRDGRPAMDMSIVMSSSQARRAIQTMGAGDAAVAWEQLFGFYFRDDIDDEAWGSGAIATKLDRPFDMLIAVDDWDRCPAERLAEEVADLADRVGACDVMLLDEDRSQPTRASIAVADRLARQRPGSVSATGGCRYVHQPEDEMRLEVPDVWGAGAEPPDNETVAEAAARRRWESIWVASANAGGQTGAAVREGLRLAQEALTRVAAQTRGDRLDG